MQKRLMFGLLFLIFTPFVYALNPIKWSLNEPFPEEIFVTGSAYSVTYTFTNQLPFTLVKPIRIEKAYSPETEFTFQDNCSGLKLAPNQSCSVTIMLDPIVIGLKEVQLTIAGYDNNRVKLPLQSSMAVQQAGRVNILSSVLTALPPSMVVNTSSVFVFQFTNTGTKTATGVTTQCSLNHCSSTCSATLSAGSSCEISGTFTPTSTTPTIQTVTGTFSFTGGTPVTASTQTTVTPAVGLTGVISGLPDITIVGSAYQVTYTYTNNNSTEMTVTTNAPQANQGICPGAGCTYLAQANTCPNPPGTLAAGSSCYMTGLFTPTALGNSTFSSTLSVNPAPGPGPSTSTLTTSTSTVAAGGVRTVHFINQCDFNVWFSMNGGAIGNSPNCTTSANCPNGTSCDPAANGGKGLCFWINPTPPAHTGGIPVNPYELEALTGENTVTVPVASNTIDINTQWSGNISASALCDGTTSCAIADCGNKGGSASCTVGQGFAQPATQFEITMIKNDRDFYDVEVINGFHIPILVTPIGGFSTGDDYNCGTPGNPTASGGFGACNWDNATPPAPTYAYYWVTKLGSCTSSNGCSVANQLCGLDSNLDKVCGDFLGYWTADNACGTNASKAQTYFGCNNYLGTPYTPNTYTMTSLYGCAVPDAKQPTLNSCYTYNNAECCGCANWNLFGITIPTGTAACKNTSNTIWTSNVQPTIQWMKSACPNYYTYPYDDVSSSFRCSSVASGSNAVGYTVTFCPDGHTGLPSGAQEGRG